jgi:HlyD family secretion protein
MNNQGSSKAFSGRTIVFITTVTAIIGTSTYYAMSQFGQTSQSAELVLPTPEIQSITALGRLEPASKVVRLSAPTMLTNDRIAQLLVERGDQVQAGQVIAVLESHNRLQKGLLEAKERVSNAQAKLAQVQAGAKTGEIRAQQAEIDRLEKEQQGEIEIQSATIARRQFELKIAQAEYNRFLKLYQEGAISVSNLDQKR